MWSRSVAHSLEFMRSHDKSQLRVLAGFRNALCVIFALIVGLITGQPLAGLAVAIGAQVAGFAGLNGTARKRFRTMLFAAFWMAITSFVGGITGGTWYAIIVIAVMGLIAGLLVCVSNEAGLVGLWATIALIFIIGTHEDPLRALMHALLVLAGGLLQTLFMILFDWLQRSNAETEAVADAYFALSDYANFHSRKADLKVAGALLEADARLRDSFLHAERWKELRKLVDIAESVRIEVVALNGMLRSRSDKVDADEAQLQEFNDARQAIADWLTSIAVCLKARVSFDTQQQTSVLRLQAIAQRVDDGLVTDDTAATDGFIAYTCIRHAYVALLQAVPLLSVKSTSTFTPYLAEPFTRSPVPQLRAAYEVIRANLTLRSATFRHAVRLAIALAVATMIYRVSPFPRGYWLPLTTLVILKPEFSTTFSRGFARVLGTLIGALFATMIMAIPDQTHLLGIVLVGVFLWGMYTVLHYNMVLFSCLLTAEVAILYSFFQDLPPMMTIVDRVIYTVAGSLLAFIAYIAWPTWQHKSVPEALAQLIANQRQYLRRLVLTSAADSPQETEKLRKRARLARTNAAKLLDEVQAEPVHGGIDDAAMQGLLAALHRFSDALLSLEYYLNNGSPELRSNPDIAQFATYVDQCMAEIESETRTLQNRTQVVSPSPEGALDKVSPFTKQQILEMDVPAALITVLIRMEDNLGTMFRMVPLMK